MAKRVVADAEPTWVELTFSYLMELISTADMVSDIYLLQAFVASGHNAWLALTVWTMISPFFVCYVPFITF